MAMEGQDAVATNAAQKPLSGSVISTGEPAGHPMPARFGNLGLSIADEPFAWTLDAEKAACAFAGVTVAPQDATLPRVARMLGVPVDTVRRWRSHPEFNERVNNIAHDASDALFLDGIAMKERRINELRKRHGLLIEIMESREEWAFVNAPDGIHGNEDGVFHIPGVQTGLMAVKRRSIGSGDMQEFIVEAELDVALLKEMRDIEVHIARELGQWQPTTVVGVNVKLYAGIDIGAV